jgi:hypothetical protein
MKKILCFDLDNTLCYTIKNNYSYSKPIKKKIKFVNSLYAKGYFIKIFTSRYMGRSSENILNAKKKGYNLTIKQLKKWKLNYHKLIFGKPSYNIFVDDKSLFYKKNWIIELKKKLKLS